MRYNSSLKEGTISLDDYVNSMKENQKKIYFITSTPDKVMKNPFMEPFKDSNVPVLIIDN